MNANQPQQSGPYAQPQIPAIVINNSSSAAASASALAGGYGYGMRRRQSAMVHFWLFLFTAGPLYAMHVSRWNKRHGF